jgi:hypothetical protein
MMRSVVAAREGPATTAAAPTANAPKPTRAVRRELSIVIRVSLSCVLRRTIGAFSNKAAFLLVNNWSIFQQGRLLACDVGLAELALQRNFQIDLIASLMKTMRDFPFARLARAGITGRAWRCCVLR